MKFKVKKIKNNEIVYCGDEIIAYLKVWYLQLKSLIGGVPVNCIPVGALRSKKRYRQSPYRLQKRLYVRTDYRNFGAEEFIEDYWLNEHNFCVIDYISIDRIQERVENENNLSLGK